MAYFGVDSVVRIEELNMKFRQLMGSKTSHAHLSQLKAIFEKMDTNQSGTLDFQEFEEALSSFG
jgi:Ca2+-binding EF-hand superfamily protein